MSTESKVKGTTTVTVGIITFLTFFVVGTLPDAALAYFLAEMGTDMELTLPQMTSFAAAGTLGTLATILIAGPLMDKFSTRKLMFVSSLVGAFAVFGRAIAPTYSTIYPFFLLIGIAAAFYFPGVNKVVSLWFEKKHLLAMNALLIAGGALGYITALNTSGFLQALLGGWRNYYIGLAVVMVIVAFLWMLLVPERSSRDAVLNESVGVIDAQHNSLKDNCKYILKAPKVWCCIFGEVGFGTAIALNVFFPATVLQLSWGLDAQTAGTLQSFNNIGSLFGYFIIPQVLMRAKAFKGKDTSMIAGLFMVITLILYSYSYLSGSNVTFMVCMLAGGFLNGISYTASRTYLLEQPEVAGLRSGTALALFNFLSTSVIFLGATGAGYLFAAMTGNEDRAMVILLSFGYIGAIAMFVLYRLNKKDTKKTMADSAANKRITD